MMAANGPCYLRGNQTDTEWLVIARAGLGLGPSHQLGGAAALGCLVPLTLFSILNMLQVSVST